VCEHRENYNNWELTEHGIFHATEGRLSLLDQQQWRIHHMDLPVLHPESSDSTSHTLVYIPTINKVDEQFSGSLKKSGQTITLHHIIHTPWFFIMKLTNSMEQSPWGVNSQSVKKLSAFYGTQALSVGVKWLGYENDHSPPSGAEVKNAWSYTSTPSIYLHGMVLS